MTVRRISGGNITKYAGGGAGSASGAGRALTAQLYPQGLALDPSGNLFVADDLHNQVPKVTPDGGIHRVGGVGSAGKSEDDGPATPATLSLPKGVGLDPEAICTSRIPGTIMSAGSPGTASSPLNSR